MNKLIIIAITLLLTACDSGYVVEGLEDTEHTAYVSIAQTWREICEDRFNEYDYPDFTERDMEQAECRRRFADGEEVLDIPTFPNVEGLNP